MLVCDRCKKPGHIHKVEFGYNYYEQIHEKSTEVAGFYGIKGEYCEECIKHMLEKMEYKHKGVRNDYKNKDDLV